MGIAPALAVAAHLLSLTSLFHQAHKAADPKLPGFGNTPNTIPAQGDYRLTTSFKPLGDLWIVTKFFSLPTVHQLEQHRGDRWVAIHSLKDLQGHVRINSAEEALEFVRYSTSLRPDLFRHPSEEVFEIQTIESLRTRTGRHRGDSSDGSPVTAHGAGGVVTAHWFRTHHIPKPHVYRNRRGWIVTRALVHVMDTGKARTVIAREMVTVHGAYSLSERAVSLQKTGEPRWSQAYRME